MNTVILFDFDGTVYDTVEGITRSVQYAILKQGLDAEPEALRCFAGPPLVEKFMEVFGFDLETANQAVADYRERYRPIGMYECRVFPGIKDVLLTLRDHGYTLGIATSTPQPLAEELLAREDMLGLFDAIVGAREDNDGTKAGVLRGVMAALGAEPSRCVLVGDTKYDVAGAKTCGVACVGVRYGYAAEGELEAAGADILVDSIPALGNYLLTLP